MKIVTIVGARPQFIKAVPLSKVLRKKHREILVHTGQHYDREMSDVFFEELRIARPDYNLGVGSCSTGKQTALMIERLERVLMKEKPDLVVIYGDTNSTLAGAIAASKAGVKSAHIEAGMRSFDRTMPEEINRVAADHLSDVFFCSTRTAVENLKKEGIDKNVFLAGDLMFDALKENIKVAKQKSDILTRLHLASKKYLLFTCHRAGNTDDKMKLSRILKVLSESGERIIFPIHPRTQKFIKLYGLGGRLGANVRIIKPVGYLDMLRLEAGAAKILTDSGGIQKEAYILHIPCVTLRENTEWVETVKDGWNVLVGSDKGKILRAINNFWPKSPPSAHYGKGRAAQKISAIIDRL